MFHSIWRTLKDLHGDDYPRIWPVNFGDPVKLFIEDTVHYQLESTIDNDSEWDALAPGDGMIYLGEDHEPHSITMFHSLRCLNVLRRDLSSKPSPTASELSRHCMNYLRQIVRSRFSGFDLLMIRRHSDYLQFWLAHCSFSRIST